MFHHQLGRFEQFANVLFPSRPTGIFNGAIGELRGVFGIHIATLAASHGLDVEDDLASTLPAAITDVERT